MMPAATHFDPVVGVDVHMVQPSGPVPPTPIPHPYIGIVFDPFDYLPIIGSTVKINGMHRAIAGTTGKALPSHFPIGGTFAPPLPQNVHENFMGSSTVQIDHDAAAYMALPCLSCQSIGMPPPPRRSPKKKTKLRSLVLPTSIVLPIPKGAPVLIGGSPTISLFALAGHLVGPLAKAIRKTKAFRKAAAAARKARRRAFRNMKPGFLKCKVLRAEPVDVVTGDVVVDQQDFELPGRIPIRWTRHYRSGSTRKGACGVGWETPADARLEPQADGVVFHDGTGVATYFDALPGAEPVLEPVDGGRLYRLDRHYAVELKGGLTYYFELPAAPGAEILVAAIVDRCRNSLHFVRDRDGLREVVESAGRRLICSSEQGLLRSIALHHPDFPERRTLVRFAYDDDNLAAVYDALDHPYTFGWDDRHRLVRHTNRTGLSFYYEYDSESRCVHSWGDGGLYDYHFEYDPVARFTNLTDSLGHPWTVEYDELLQITRETDPLGGITSYAYDEVGRTTAVVDPAGRITGYVYDEQGNLVELTRPDGTKSAMGYDFNGNPTEHVDPNGASWTMTWDARGQLRERVSPRGACWRYDYDSAAGDLLAVTDPLGARLDIETDHLGNVTGVVDALGSRQQFVLDYLSNVIRYTDGEGFETRYSYDKKGRILEVSYPSGASTGYGYDDEDRLTSFRDPNGSLSFYAYFGLGELGQRRQADGTVVQTEYDTEERITAVTNECDQVFQLVRDPLGRVVKEIDYWGGTKSYSYDTAGNITAITDAIGRTTRFTYDALDRLKCRRFEDGTTETFGYDRNGNLISAENLTIKVSRVFDDDGNLVEERQGEFCIQSDYDLAGNRICRRSTHGNELCFGHDSVGQVREIRINRGSPMTMRYDRRGLLASEQLTEELGRSYSYDGDGMLLRQELSRSSQTVIARRYHYGPSGMLQRTDNVGGVTRVFEFERDPMDRITRWTDGTTRLDRHVYAPTGTLLRDLGVADGGERRAAYKDSWYAFNAAGNLVRRMTPAGEVRFEWDQMNRLVGVRNASGQTVTMSYDALGRRVGKAVGQVHTHFVWDGDILLSDSSGDALGHGRNPSDHGAREFVFRPDGYEPLALIGETIQYFDNDLVGLPHDLVASDGTSTWTSCYDALGGSYGTRSDACPLRLQGQYFDSETGLSYNRHRYYDPHIGAFISADPLGLEGGHDLYRYAPNIWDWVDIFGLRCQFTGIAKKAKWVRSRQGVEGPGLRGHFGKHGSQVGARNARDYDMSARRTVQNGRRFTYRDRSSGERRVGYWDPDTGFFTATSQTRRTPTIMTHFPETWENLRKLPGFAT